MKLTHDQLRRIVREAIDQQRVTSVNEEREVLDVAGQLADYVVEALVVNLENSVDVYNHARRLMKGAGDVPVPARREDVDDFARSAADIVVQDPVLKDEIERICRNLIDMMM